MTPGLTGIGLHPNTAVHLIHTDCGGSVAIVGLVWPFAAGVLPLCGLLLSELEDLLSFMDCDSSNGGCGFIAEGSTKRQTWCRRETNKVVDSSLSSTVIKEY